MKEKITSWQNRRISAINRWSKKRGIPCNDLNPYFNEYNAILSSQSKTKKQYKGEKMTEEKKDWSVTLSCMKKHEDTYLIRNVAKEDAIYIAENQNRSSRFDCTLVKEEVSDGEDEETSIRPLDYQKEVK